MSQTPALLFPRKHHPIVLFLNICPVKTNEMHMNQTSSPFLTERREEAVLDINLCDAPKHVVPRSRSDEGKVRSKMMLTRVIQ